MIDDDEGTSNPLERVPSGLPGLDAILGGGFFRGGVYMVRGAPGMGKTILGSQMCFSHVASGGRALFVTLLTESHARLIASVQRMAFFDSKQVGAALTYVTGYETLERENLKGLVGFLRQLVRDHKATLLIIDGFITAGAMAESEVETKKFIHELQAFIELVGCTTLLLTGATETTEQYALRTMVDGLVELRLESMGMEAARTMEVRKFRGSRVLMGRHQFEIDDAGITIYPRTEAHRGRALAPADRATLPTATFGVKGLDAMLDGGLRRGSVSMALGAPGAGKTLLGLSLLDAGADAGEPGTYFGFFETPADLCRKADAIGLGLSDHVKSGKVEILWQSPFDSMADALAERVLASVRERGARRLFVDGFSGFKESLLYTDRTQRFFDALLAELRALGIVTLISDEMRDLREIHLPEHGILPMFDTVICLRHVERQTRVHKLISLIKAREGACDPSLRPFSITTRGFVVASGERKTAATIGRRRRAR